MPDEDMCLNQDIVPKAGGSIHKVILGGNTLILISPKKSKL
jgi:hypothetical protein